MSCGVWIRKVSALGKHLICLISHVKWPMSRAKLRGIFAIMLVEFTICNNELQQAAFKKDLSHAGSFPVSPIPVSPIRLYTVTRPVAPWRRPFDTSCSYDCNQCVYCNGPSPEFIQMRVCRCNHN